MATPASPVGTASQARENSTTTNPSAPRRPTNTLLDTQSTTDVLAAAQMDQGIPGKRRKNHRGGKKKRNNRRQSFLPGPEDDTIETARSGRNLQDTQNSGPARPPFYRLGQSGGRNLSETSLDSNALLDHR